MSDKNAPTFLPSDTAPVAAGSSYTEGWEGYAPFLRELFFGDDARVEAAVLQQRITTLQRQIASTRVAPVRAYYQGQLTRAQAQLHAVQQQAGEQQFSADTNKIVRVITIAAGVGLTVALVAVANSQLQQAKLLRKQRQRLNGE